MSQTRHLRRTATRYERILWRHLRNRKFENYKFRRQHPIGRYILDFYCPEVQLAVELDGGGHSDTAERLHDEARAQLLAREGITIMRFWNHQVSEGIDDVMRAIWLALEGRKNPSP